MILKLFKFFLSFEWRDPNKPALGSEKFGRQNVSNDLPGRVTMIWVLTEDTLRMINYGRESLDTTREQILLFSSLEGIV